MKKHASPILIILALTIALVALTLGGCARKHIVSSPPAQRPAKRVEPAPKPTVVEEAPEVIEDTYIVDAPKEEAAPAPRVEEGNLEEEPLAAPAQVEAVAPEAAPEVAKETAAEAAVEAADVAPMAEMYYVQVGAFSDLENANNVLSGLIADGYKGSKLSKTESGLFRVQAGAFADKAAAEDVLMKLQAEYPKGFVLKGPVEE